VRDHDDGLAALRAGRADAYASDEIILIGLARGAKDATDLRLSGTIYSYEPYALMVRKCERTTRTFGSSPTAPWRRPIASAILERSTIVGLGNGRCNRIRYWLPSTAFNPFGNDIVVFATSLAYSRRQ
jgi:hypothetical protein